MERALRDATVSSLDHLSKPFVSSPDFRSKLTDQKYDLTVNTASSIKTHESRAYFKDGSTQFIFYDRPANFAFK
jgi:hypothetical protein